MISVESFMMDGVDILHFVGVERRGISIDISGKVSGFVSIATKRDTS